MTEYQAPEPVLDKVSVAKNPGDGRWIDLEIISRNGNSLVVFGWEMVGDTMQMRCFRNVRHADDPCWKNSEWLAATGESPDRACWRETMNGMRMRKAVEFYEREHVRPAEIKKAKGE